MQLKEIDFSSLEFREIGTWPTILRAGVILAACVATLVVMYFLVFSGELDNLSNAETQLDAKTKEFKDDYTMAVNIDAYKAQMTEMQAAYAEYIKQLPTSSNIPELLESLTKIGERNGLKINSIKIGDPKLISGFYMALPLTLSINGGYHNIGLFINETSKLARIVTLHDFTLKPSVAVAATSVAAAAGTTGDLQMDMQTQTYWLASPAEIEAATPANTTTNKGKAKGATGTTAPAAPGAPGAPAGAPAGIPKGGSGAPTGAVPHMPSAAPAPKPPGAAQ